ncbi:uncharacterized protein ACLA_057740 [Aspergillus clavatus NRRL 1]|uniref:FAD/NAD(P)-binding domain-containing protein n=1 Tax=Aspergillus clavatus (strain ATCC 1007 / CBS 513.65 / DSM 816 / NCTC 3887 / NRRL 1 / QM 1276 / 107) TaxID=344612 RepID=A1C3X8_ASPCL|nr:uncharacterized protein ACLA_057740 [Aspergillus clavatus NRRL 1]EAW15118.1 conserved hypothetical protein [Aspergillus clavatus NRRL 1]
MSLPQKCAAVVVGAGPAGLAVVGNLLEKQVGKVAWVDPFFQAGRVGRKYREVPSNTKVSFFQAYATGVQPFRAVVSSSRIPNAFTTLAKLDQDKTCQLEHGAEMVEALTEGIVKMDRVVQCRGLVVAANLAENTSSWTVRIKNHETSDEFEVETPRLILCTGSSPSTGPIPVPGHNIQRLDLDVVLKPSELSSYLPRNTPVTIAVVGASHSAILSLLNLVELARSSHPQLRVKWFTRHPLRYAEFMDGWILRDNTGLKGLAADFARSQLEDQALPTSEAGRFITKVDCGNGKEMAQFKLQLPLCSHIVQAIGYTRDPLPELSANGAALEPDFDHETGGFYDQNGRTIKGLYGAGIAFPERTVDPHGNVEYAVGFFKFMKFIKRVSPQWVSA